MTDLTIKRENNKYIITITAKISNVDVEMFEYLAPFLHFNCVPTYEITYCSVCEKRDSMGTHHWKYFHEEICLRCVKYVATIKPRDNTYTVGNTVVVNDGNNITAVITDNIDLLYNKAALQLTPKVETIPRLCKMCFSHGCMCKCYRKFMDQIMHRESVVLIILQSILPSIFNKIIQISMQLRSDLWQKVCNAFNETPKYKEFIFAYRLPEIINDYNEKLPKIY